jgi:hypothetical protein
VRVRAGPKNKGGADCGLPFSIRSRCQLERKPERELPEAALIMVRPANIVDPQPALQRTDCDWYAREVTGVQIRLQHVEVVMIEYVESFRAELQLDAVFRKLIWLSVRVKYLALQLISGALKEFA